MDGITLKQLKYFEAVAKHGHFGRAADLCSISQPAISVQIKELEHTLGQTLFERNARRVQLTSFGADFRGRVLEVLRRVDDLKNLADAHRTSVAGTLHLGVIPTIAPYFVPGVIRDLNREFPDLDLHVRETLTDRLLAELSEGTIDVAIVALPVLAPGLSEVHLFDEAFLLVRSEEDEGKPVPDPTDLARMRLLLLEEGHCLRDQALSFCELPSINPHHGMEGSSLSTLVQMVSVGLGVTLIPEIAVKIERRSAEVSIARFPKPEPTRKIGLVWRKSNPLASQYTKIADVMRATAKDLI